MYNKIYFSICYFIKYVCFLIRKYKLYKNVRIGVIWKEILIIKLDLDVVIFREGI